ncbi:hypothetical protein [Mycobacteroides abscessus]|uniref:hypothetical protein n=1 Tax=Mycobacteroides abscessus TaxID=36809 RepID=UPI0005A545E5|nr:hypothetical protein [Mycobacteroides abscessus]
MTISALYSKDNAPGRARHSAAQGWLITVTGAPAAVRAAAEYLAVEGAYTRIITGGGQRARVKLPALRIEQYRHVAIGSGRVRAQYVIPKSQRTHEGKSVSLDALMLYRAVAAATDIGAAQAARPGSSC